MINKLSTLSKYSLKQLFSLQAHRAVLVARSPYFYRQMYLRRKKLKYLYQFCRFTLPIDVNFDVVDAVVSYMYTGKDVYDALSDPDFEQKIYRRCFFARLSFFGGC